MRKQTCINYYEETKSINYNGGTNMHQLLWGNKYASITMRKTNMHQLLWETNVHQARM